MYCSTAGISDLKTFVQFLHLICFLVSPETVRELLLACWRAVPGCSGLQGIYGEALEPQSPWTPPLSPLLSPFSSCGAAPLLSHLCFSLCCGFLPKCFLGCAFWVLCSPLFLLFFSACRVLLPGSCHRDHSTSLCLCERHCYPCVAWLAEPAASSQMCHLSLPHTVWPDCPVGWQAAYLCPGMHGYAIVLHSRLPVSIPDLCTVVEDNELLSSPMARLPLPSSMPLNFNPLSAFHLLGTVVLLVCKDQSSKSASAYECQGAMNPCLPGLTCRREADGQRRGKGLHHGLSFCFLPFVPWP